MRTLCIGLWWTITFGSAAPASVAQADNGQPVASSGEPAYEELIDQAVNEFRRGNYPEAYSLFERAHAVQPNARTLRGMGIAAFEDRRYVKCVQHLRAALEDPRKPLTDDLRQQTEELLQRASGYVAQYTLDLSPANAKLVVDSRPPVVVDGILLLDPGEHEIVVSVDGHQEARHVEAHPNESLVLSIHVAASGEKQAEESEPSWWTTRRKAGLATASVSAASLVASLGLTLKARSERDAADCDGGVCPNEDAKNQFEHARTLGTAATATVVAGAALAAGGAALLLWPTKKSPGRRDEGTTAHVVPALSPRFAGVQVGGRW